MMATLLSGCGVIGVDSYCNVAQPIYMSCKDRIVDSSARQILDHNEIGKELCGWEKGKGCNDG